MMDSCYALKLTVHLKEPSQVLHILDIKCNFLFSSNRVKSLTKVVISINCCCNSEFVEDWDHLVSFEEYTHCRIGFSIQLLNILFRRKIMWIRWKINIKKKSVEKLSSIISLCLSLFLSPSLTQTTICTYIQVHRSVNDEFINHWIIYCSLSRAVVLNSFF